MQIGIYNFLKIEFSSKIQPINISCPFEHDAWYWSGLIQNRCIITTKVEL